MKYKKLTLERLRTAAYIRWDVTHDLVNGETAGARYINIMLAGDSSAHYVLQPDNTWVRHFFGYDLQTIIRIINDQKLPYELWNEREFKKWAMVELL